MSENKTEESAGSIEQKYDDGPAVPEGLVFLDKLYFIQTFAHANNLRVESKEMPHEDLAYSEERTSIISIDNKVIYTAIGRAFNQDAAKDDAIEMLFAQLMQRLMLRSHGFVTITPDGIDLRYDNNSITAVVHDRGSKTMTLTLVAK